MRRVLVIIPTLFKGLGGDSPTSPVYPQEVHLYSLGKEFHVFRDLKCPKFQLDAGHRQWQL